MRIEKLTQTFDIVARYVHFPLHPDTPKQGRSLQDLFGGGADAVKARHAKMATLMAVEGLRYAERTHTYNSRLAQELGKWADTQDGGVAIHDALFRAYFVDRRNLADLDVLLDVAQSVGLPPAAARQVLEERSFSDAVDKDWARSRQLGVTGVPTFVAGQAGVVGAQPFHVIEQLLIQAGANRRS